MQAISRHCDRAGAIVLGAVLGMSIGSIVLASAGELNPKRLEIKITSNGSDVVAGEPEIAINPRNPKNLYLVHATLPAPAPGHTGMMGQVPSDAPVPPHSCGGYVSMNGGKTWTLSALPFEPQSKLSFSECEDGAAAFGPDGTLYAGGDPDSAIEFVGAPPNCPPGAAPAGTSCVEPEGDDVLARSTDGGLTWKLLPRPLGTPKYCPTCKYAPGSGHPNNVFDRPWLVVDQSTGVVYITSRNILDHERFVTASTNKGDSFGLIYAIDSPTYPEANGGDSNLVVANGVIAEVYTAEPATGGCGKQCTIFETSTDYGATWSRHVVPLVGAGSRPRPFLAGFAGYGPEHLNSSFALSVLDSTGTLNQVYATHDQGNNWDGPVQITDSANQHFKPWLSYTPMGQLVLLWRTWHPQGSIKPYDVWAAMGVDTGRSIVFSAPLAVSSVAAPYGPGGGGGDDFSFVAADQEYVHASWGDSRSGATQVWYSRIPYSDFEWGPAPSH